MGYNTFVTPHPDTTPKMGAIIDLGHRATNLCVFDQNGLVFTRSFMQGGEKLTREIAEALNISFEEAQIITAFGKLNFLLNPADTTEENSAAWFGALFGTSRSYNANVYRKPNQWL